MENRKILGRQHNPMLRNPNPNLPASASDLGLAWCSTLLDESTSKPKSASGSGVSRDASRFSVSQSPSGVYWSSKWLDDNRLRVKVTGTLKKYVDDDDDPDKDPFDPDFHLIVAEILLDYLQHHGLVPDPNRKWRIDEILSAQRVAYPEQFEYHMFFSIVDVISRSQHNVFGQVEISRANIEEFIPEIHRCVVIPKSHDSLGYDRGCHICCAWVTHPRLVKKFPDAPLMEMWPVRSYITKDVKRFCPKKISHTFFRERDYAGKETDIVAVVEAR